MPKLRKVLFVLSLLMIIWHVINYFFYKGDLTKTLSGIVPMLLLIILTQLKENQDK